MMAQIPIARCSWPATEILYGTAQVGGVYGFGTVFRISLDGTLATLAQFDGDQGANPQARLIQGTDGNLYGTTLTGGASEWE